MYFHKKNTTKNFINYNPSVAIEKLRPTILYELFVLLANALGLF